MMQQSCGEPVPCVRVVAAVRDRDSLVRFHSFCDRMLCGRPAGVLHVLLVEK